MKQATVSVSRVPGGVQLHLVPETLAVDNGDGRVLVCWSPDGAQAVASALMRCADKPEPSPEAGQVLQGFEPSLRADPESLKPEPQTAAPRGSLAHVEEDGTTWCNSVAPLAPPPQVAVWLPPDSWDPLRVDGASKPKGFECHSCHRVWSGALRTNSDGQISGIIIPPGWYFATRGVYALLVCGLCGASKGNGGAAIQ